MRILFTSPVPFVKNKTQKKRRRGKGDHDAGLDHLVQVFYITHLGNGPLKRDATFEV